MAGSDTLPGYFRFPELHGDAIILTAEGDLWATTAAGGIAHRLTTHHGVETHARIAPNGAAIAFAAQYHKGVDVYVMPMDGGVPVRITFTGDSVPVQWYDDTTILVRTRHYSTLPDTQLVLVKTTDRTVERVPLSQASDGVYDRDGKTLYFTRLRRQPSHTRRYRGGTAQNIWTFNGSDEAVPLTADYTGTDRHPMLWNNRIFFVTDRDGTLNIWSMTPAGADLQQHTFHTGWDVKSPRLHDGRIVYQCGADVYLLDIDKGTAAAVPIRLISDFEQMRVHTVEKPLDYLTSAHLSPDGDRVAATIRGCVFVFPAESGRIVEVTRQPGIRYRNAAFLPDGDDVLVMSDQSGEVEFWQYPANGLGAGRQVTHDAEVLIRRGLLSPDGKWLAYTDLNQRLWLHDTATSGRTLIVQSEEEEISDLSWSPDSGYLAFMKRADNGYPGIAVYHRAEDRIIRLTSDRVDSYGPVWSQDGEWLYFLSDRNLESQVKSPWGPRQPEPYFDRTTEIYHVALRADARSPFLPANELKPPCSDADDKDTATDEGDQDSFDDDAPSAPESVNEDGSDKDDEVAVTLDEEGIMSRVYRVPVPAGNYESLSITGSHLFWIEQQSAQDKTKQLTALKIGNDKPKPEKIVAGKIKHVEISADSQKLLVRMDNNLYVIDASGSPPGKLDDTRVSFDSWTLTVDPREEWRQIFVDAWRLERDYFYDRNLHGLDWRGLLDKHQPLLARVTDRYELNDLIAQMVSELGALHIYVQGGDRRRDSDKRKQGYLGAVLTREPEADGYRITRIYQSDPDFPDELSPLVRHDSRVREGDVITAINGVDILSLDHPAAALLDQAGKQVRLELISVETSEPYSEIVEPLSGGAARGLRYRDWELSRRRMVEEAGNNEIGYVHLRAMSGGNYSEWASGFYPVHDRKGLIVDVRHNRGGNTASWILEKLLRKAWFYWQPRIGAPTWGMQYAFRGHIVVLCDTRTASNGETFAEGIRRLGLGTLIGTRTWGGQIWLTFSNKLVDRGIATAAEIGVYGAEGEWLIEGHGVEPDIVIDNPPYATFNGDDAQLRAAIDFLRQRIHDAPVDVPVPPPYPNKAFPYP